MMRVNERLARLAAMAAELRATEDFEPHRYNDFIARADEVILNEALPPRVRLRALQIMEDVLGDGATVTEGDLHSYLYDTQG
jgi:hypothetical protein